VLGTSAIEADDRCPTLDERSCRPGADRAEHAGDEIAPSRLAHRVSDRRRRSARSRHRASPAPEPRERSGLGTSHPSESARRTIMLNSPQTVAASRSA
jgi:hypothetical protein